LIYIFVYINVVGILSPEVLYLFIYWVCGPIRGRGFFRGSDIFVKRVCNSK